MSVKSSGMFGLIRTAVVVTMIAALLWLMAESQMIQSQTVTVQIVLVSGEGERVGATVVRASPDAEWKRTVEVTFEGATSELDRVVRQMGGKLELHLGREIPTTPGRHDLDLRALWRQHPGIESSGVRVAAVVPESVRVEVDELVSVDLDVRVQIPQGVQVQGTPQSDPEQVKLIGPAGVVARLQRQGVEARAVVDPVRVGEMTAGRTETVRGVAVELWGVDEREWATRVAPGRIDVRVLLRSLTETLDLEPMPVQVLVAPDEIGRYVIKISPADRDVVGVTVTGPGEAIESIRSGSVVPTAFLALSLDQLESRVTSAQIEVHGLPEGVKVVGAARTVQLTISPVEVSRQPEGSTTP